MSSLYVILGKYKCYNIAQNYASHMHGAQKNARYDASAWWRPFSSPAAIKPVWSRRKATSCVWIWDQIWGVWRGICGNSGKGENAAWEEVDLDLVLAAAVEREMRDSARVSFYREANRGCSLLAGPRRPREKKVAQHAIFWWAKKITNHGKNDVVSNGHAFMWVDGPKADPSQTVPYLWHLWCSMRLSPSNFHGSTILLLHVIVQDWQEKTYICEV
jgi:hypothetical protein